MRMYAHAIPIILDSEDGTRIQTGIHLLWMGPFPSVYSVPGWEVSRREILSETRTTCGRIAGPDLDKLATDQELRIPGMGNVILGTDEAHKWEVFTLELEEAQNHISVKVEAETAYAFALRQQKRVASLQPRPSLLEGSLLAVGIEKVVIFSHKPTSLEFCIHETIPVSGAPGGWTRLSITDPLNLPLEILDGVGTDEYAKAVARQKRGEFPGEGKIDSGDFARLTALLSDGVSRIANPALPGIRAIDEALLLREDTHDSFAELSTLDPLRMLFIKPAWRRALGLGFFDDVKDATGLVEGHTYQYKIVGKFPRRDSSDHVYSFSTVPSTTRLPSLFFLNRLLVILPQPTTVEVNPPPQVLDPSNNKKLLISRRGITLSGVKQEYWDTGFLTLRGYSAFLLFPSPLPKDSVVILEMADDPAPGLTFDAFDIGFKPKHLDEPVGLTGRIDLTTDQVSYMGLRGTGFLCGIRVRQPGITKPDDFLDLTLETLPVTLAATPPPAPPFTVILENLQQPHPVPVGPTPDPVSPNEAIGFKVSWVPPTIADFLPDSSLLEAIAYQIEHVETDPDGVPLDGKAWAPVQSAEAWPDENWTMGDRNAPSNPQRVHFGSDLMELFPEYVAPSPGGTREIHWKDVFELPKKGDDPSLPSRPLPVLGTYHRYRVRSVDILGRPSDRWTASNTQRLEKHVPPPQPVSPEPVEDKMFEKPQPDEPEPPTNRAGVEARALLRDSPDLTAEEEKLLDDNKAGSNLIILRWGWREQQRSQDPYAREFRVYIASPPPNLFTGFLTLDRSMPRGAGEQAQLYRVKIKLDQRISEDAIKGKYLTTAYPFFVERHKGGEAGEEIEMILSTSVPDEEGNYPVPENGTVRFLFSPDPTFYRPPAWTKRLGAVPVAIDPTKSVYEFPIVDQLMLSPDHPKDSIWVGVSAADSESYVDDTWTESDPRDRKGNESPIAAVTSTGRYRARPVFNAILPMDDVPVLRMPEPMGRPLRLSLDLRPYFEYLKGLGGDQLDPDDLVFPERAAAAAVFAAFEVSIGGDIMPLPIDPESNSDGPLEPIAAVVVPNAEDKRNIIAALKGNSTTALANRHVVFLAGRHPHRDRLFAPTVERPLTLRAFTDSLPPSSGRYVYRVRKSVGGHLSRGSALAKVIVRVPSLVAGPVPQRLGARPHDGVGLLRLRILPDPTVTAVLVYSRLAVNAEPMPQAPVIRRIPNRIDVDPVLQTSEGTFLEPQRQQLSGPNVTADADGNLEMTLTFTGNHGERVQVWACTLTEDGIPSSPGGGWSVRFPIKPLAPPTNLSVDTARLPLLKFAWSFPAAKDQLETALQRSPDDGLSWERVTPLLSKTTTSLEYTQHAGVWRYRLAVFSPDGRDANSNEAGPVTV